MNVNVRTIMSKSRKIKEKREENERHHARYNNRGAQWCGPARTPFPGVHSQKKMAHFA